MGRRKLYLVHSETTQPVTEAVDGNTHSDRGMRKAPQLVRCLNQEKYIIEDSLGLGGLGGIYLASRASDGKQVAIKLTRRAHDYAAGQCLRRESDILGRLCHRNIVKALDYGLTRDEEPYLVMEYIRGQSLERFVYEQGQLSLQTSLRICIQLAQAMEYVHGCGVIHKDLKPANIIIEQGCDSPVILDFGISQHKTAEFAPLQRYGTPLYMSPEQILDCVCTEKSDVYQLGLILFFCLTGELPFPALNEESIVRYKLGCGPVWRRDQYPELQPVESVLSLMLAREPHMRLASMSQVARLLTTVEDTAGVCAVA